MINNSNKNNNNNQDKKLLLEMGIIASGQREGKREIEIIFPAQSVGLALITYRRDIQRERERQREKRARIIYGQMKMYTVRGFIVTAFFV